MGVFSKKSKVKEQDGYGFGNGAEATPLKSSMTFKRKQKPVIAPLPQIDLSTALPDNTDFRTSMLMPQLSARFSMLREQDDPATKVGKASDDSVLFPKRASRLNLFSHNPLTDIAEVESIHSTFRPPFAHNDRASSISDGYASDDGGSIMGRSRHGEGNNLFGGRQKIYRIAASSSSSKTLTGGSGKHTYGEDVSLSSFQQYRQQTKDGSFGDGDGEAERLRNSQEYQEENGRVNSPFTAFSKNRGTTSSTTSGPSNRRTSTAATSVTCESPIPRQNSGYASKPRTSDFLNDIDEQSIKRNPSSESRRAFAMRDEASQPPLPKPLTLNHTLSKSRSAVNLNDKFNRPSPFSTNTFNRAVSPPPTNTPTMSSLEFGLQDSSKQNNAQSRRYQTASPTNERPGEVEGDHIYSNALQPNDRGKATAMGLFNRPAQQFDENQFLQRHRQMHEGRSSPFFPEPRSESRAENETASPAMRRIDSALGNHEGVRTSAASQDIKLNGPGSPFGKGVRNFNLRNKPEAPITQARKNSDAPTIASTAANVKARVESLIRRQNAELAEIEAEKGYSGNKTATREASMDSENLNQSNGGGTFFNGFDASDDEVGDSPRRDSNPRTVPSDVHPALRGGMNDFDFGDSVSTKPHAPFNRQSAASNYSTSHSVRHERKPSQPKGSESPTLGASGLGLSGLISRHLRNDSDRSSLPPQSPVMSGFARSTASREVSMASTTHTVNPPESVHSDPWEFDRAPRSQQSHYTNERRPSEPQSPPMSNKAQKFFGRDQPQSKAQQVLGREAPNRSNDSVDDNNWQEELHSAHQRGESTETQRERREFDDDLAERQRKIQERLKSNAEIDQRSRSPMRQALPHAFQGLRHKTSKGSMTPPSAEPQPNSKAMKMLGITGGPPSHDIQMRSPNPNMHREREYEQNPRYDDRQWRPQQRPPPQVDSNYPPNSGRRTPGGGRTTPNGRTTPHGNPSYEEFERQRQRSNTPNSGRAPSAGPGARNRANSAAANRSRSRQGGPYRDDENYPPHSDSRYSPPHMRNGPGPEQMRGPTPNGYRDEGRSTSAMGNRARNNSRAQGPGYFDNRSPTPNMPMVNVPPGDMAPRPSPRPPVPASPISPAYAQPSPAFAGPPPNFNSPASPPMPPIWTARLINTHRLSQEVRQQNHDLRADLPLIHILGPSCWATEWWPGRPRPSSSCT